MKLILMATVLRGDLPRLARVTSIITESASSPIKRSKPLKYAYEKEIVLYAHHKKLDYFCTECIYSPEAFRGSARTLIKNLERLKPSSILDVVKSGEDMAKCVPSEITGVRNGSKSGGGVENGAVAVVEEEDEEGEGGCGSAHGRSNGGQMAEMERRLQEQEQIEGMEVEVRSPSVNGQRHDRYGEKVSCATASNVDSEGLRPKVRGKGHARTAKRPTRQQMGQCERCGYLSSQAVCKACTLLEDLNKNRPTTSIAIQDGDGVGRDLPTRLDAMSLSNDKC